MENTSATTVSFRISKIQEIEFLLLEPSKELALKLINENAIRINSKIRFHWNSNEKVFSVVFAVNYYYIIDGNRQDLIRITLETAFFIPEFNEAVKLKDPANPDDKTFKMADPIMQVFLGVAYSNVRGVLFAKTQGSFMNQFYLPLSSGRELLEDFRKGREAVKNQ